MAAIKIPGRPPKKNTGTPDVCVTPAGPRSPKSVPYPEAAMPGRTIQKMSIGGISSKGAKDVMSGKLPDSANDKLRLAHTKAKASSGDEAGTQKDMATAGSASIMLGKGKAFLKH